MTVLSWLFSSRQSLTARLGPEGPPFPVARGQSLLDAALAAGIRWPWRCRVGSCGVCKCRVKSGKVRALTDFSYVLRPEQLAQDYVLACQTRPLTDVIVTMD